MRTLWLMLLVISSATLLGCGQKGPLVLPDAQRPHRQIGLPRQPANKTPVAPAPGAPAPAGPGATAAPTPAPATPDGNQASPDAALQ